MCCIAADRYDRYQRKKGAKKIMSDGQLNVTTDNRHTKPIKAGNLDANSTTRPYSAVPAHCVAWLPHECDKSRSQQSQKVSNPHKQRITQTTPINQTDPGGNVATIPDPCRQSRGRSTISGKSNAPKQLRRQQLGPGLAHSPGSLWVTQ